MRRRGVWLIAATLAVVAILSPSPAAAATGSITFHCTAHLPAWPTAAGWGECNDGTTPAFGFVNLAGADSGAWAVQGVGAFHAEFDYQAACIANEPPLAGTAHGVATVEDVPAVHRGVVTTADVHANFDWTRVGADAVIVVTAWSIEFFHGGTAGGSTGAGTATFVPRIEPDNFCPVGGPLEALVQGEVTAAV